MRRYGEAIERSWENFRERVHNAMPWNRRREPEETPESIRRTVQACERGEQAGRQCEYARERLGQLDSQSLQHQLRRGEPQRHPSY